MRRRGWGAGLLLALAAGAADAATITVQFNDGPSEGFNDPSAFTAVGGNNATTLGQARRNVFQRAADILEARLQSNITITVAATFDPLTCDDTSGILGFAGPGTYFANFPNRPLADVFYPVALADALANQNFQSFSPDIEATFNSRVDDDPGCLQDRNFYYGFDHNSASFADDLINTVLHELSHGLGFASLVDPGTGVSGVAPDFSIYDLFVFDETRNQSWPALTDAQRAASAVNTGRLVWNGSRSTAESGRLSAGVNASGRIRLYAPNPVEPGSSVSHWDTVAMPNLLMEPFSTDDIRGTEGTDFTTCLLADLGWLLTPGTNCPDAVNRAPVANPQTVSTSEDTARLITLTGSDPDGDPLTFTIVTAPTRGTLSGSGANRTYTPNANTNGTDTFTFRVNDGTTDSAPATVTINVAAVNDAPVANAQTVSATEDTARAITLTGSDVEGSALTFTIVSNPGKGTLSGSGASRTYTPNANTNGTDTFTFRVNDGTIDSAPATVTINVAAVNDAPVANPQTVSTSEDTARAITLTGSDPDGDPLTFTIMTAPTRGTLSGSGASRTYTPNANTSGTDTFTFRVNDGSTDSAPATVTINVAAVNDAPVANAQTVSATEDTARAITLGGSDVEGSALTFTIVSNPGKGTLSGSGASRTYTPNANTSGTDTFTFRVNDGTTDSAPATVTINVAAVNDAPVANPQTVSTPEDTARAITLSGSDVEGSALTFTIVSNPTRGTLSGSGANRTYTPNANTSGTDTFTFRVNDGSTDSAPATVTINVAAVNDAPVATPQTVSTPQNTARAITLAGTDVEGSALTFTIVTAPTRGTLSGSAPNLTYTPNTDVTGADTFTFRVNDGAADSAAATVTINVTNAAPTANPQTVSATEDTARSITLTGADPDGDPLTFTIVTPPTKGTLSGSGASRTYTPNANTNGTDTFTFRVNDGSADSAPATVTINVAAVNDAPTANAQTVSASEDTASVITLGGSDIEGSALTFTIVAAPTRGTLSGSGASRTYTPNANTSGTDTFTFRVNDGTTDSAPATVTINVAAVNDAPVANAQTVSASEDTAGAITLSGSDVEGSALTFTIVAAPTRGTLSGSGASRTYTPNANTSGTDTFTFRVNDGSTDSAPATVTINVAAVNDAPVATPQTVSTPQNTARAITLAGTDLEGSALTFTIVAAPTRGTLSGSGANRTYTPNVNTSGTDTFTFRVNDGAADSAPATVTINVIAGNRPPVANAQTVSATEDTPRAITLTGADPDGNPLTFTIVTPPTKGTLGDDGADRSYRPNANANGTDTFTFRVNDGSADSAPATVTINIAAVDDPPPANPQTVSATSGRVVTITLASATDDDNQTLVFTIVSGPTNGTLSGSGPTRTYTARSGFVGVDRFTFRSSDGTTTSAPATITINVAAVPDSGGGGAMGGLVLLGLLAAGRRLRRGLGRRS